MKWYTPLGAVTVWEHSPSGEVLIADCRNPNLPLASQRVNARLAAAAPDLLAALEDITERYERLLVESRITKRDTEAMREMLPHYTGQARAAIARAS